MAKCCEASGCELDATTRVYWPGRAIDMCGEHAQQAQKVSAAMGIELSTTPVTALTPPPASDASITLHVLELGPPRPSPETVIELARRVDNPFARHELDMLAQEIEQHHTIGSRQTQIADCLARVLFAIGGWRLHCYSDVPGFEAITSPKGRG